MFMALLLSSVFALTGLIILAFGVFLRDQLAPLIEGIGSNQALSLLILEVSLGGFFVTMLLLVLVFVAVGRNIAKPISVITAGMQSFVETGKKPEIVIANGAPKEIKSLASAFDTFTESVDEVHKHDVEISRVKSDFISTAAHQLRTPLTGIRWALEALQMENLTESQKTLVANATEKSHQLVAVVGTLLDISSIESGKYKYEFKKTPIDEVVSLVTKDFEPLAVKGAVSLLFEKSGQESAIVSIDRERIRWVLNNLVENGIRYTPQGGAVRITTERAPERVLIRVKDTGIGIAPEDRGNIFERFYRAPNAIAKENAGNGLGLYIARTIANDHGGDLNFESNKEGPGTTFTLSLPVAG
jgi:signal transduction histidine kinase